MTRHDHHVSMTPERFKNRFLHHLRYTRGLTLEEARPEDHLAALQLTVREALIDRAVATREHYEARQPKKVCYLSMEFLVGRLLMNNLIATGLLDTARRAMQELGLNLDLLSEEEPDPGLGNGGLGRLAACFLDSLATLDYPAFGYGLRYDYGLFRQELVNGWQVETPDVWLKNGYAWEIPRPDLTVPVPMGGHIEWRQLPDGQHRPVWTGQRVLYGVPHDVLVAGYGTRTVATLRLWKAEAPKEFDFRIFSQGDFVRAVAERERIEAISRVLYPADDVEAGRRLRLQQEYFLVACSVRDALNRFRLHNGEAWGLLPDRVAFQLNDTHPALTVAELMRQLMDEGGLEWPQAWEITVACCGYTNHTLLPEALESWPVGLLEEFLPRHVQIIREIDRRFLAGARRRLGDDPAHLQRISLLAGEGEPRVRMANLAIVGSHRVNGVARLHTRLLRERLVPELAELFPDRFIPITNGITPRRWLLACNPRLAGLVTEAIGDGWERDLDRLADLLPLASDTAFQERFLEVKRANKADLAQTVAELTGISIDPESLYDVQIKRLHEYKRQLLNVLHIIAVYRRLKAAPGAEVTPRTFIFGAKAAPAYHRAKLIIRLITAVAETINSDPGVADRLKVVFLPDYRVTLAEKIIPAADLSEQISTAGKEASGTGNMKLALNGALTIGTLDGANIEIRDAVGEDNIFIFGLTADQVAELQAGGTYDPWLYYNQDEELRAVLDALRDGVFGGPDAPSLRELWSALLEEGDPYFHLADFRPYADAQQRAASLYVHRGSWAAKAIRNVAAMGYFSSDRAIREYAQKIWDLHPVPIPPQDG